MAKILIVDDSLFVRVAVKNYLAGTPHEIVGEARDGVEAVRLAAKLRPDVIIMDVVMPNMDGVEATRQIMRSSPSRIIMLSAAAESGGNETLMALRAGAVDFLQKPDTTDIHFIRSVLIGKIETVLSSHVAHPVGDKKAAGGRIAKSAFVVVAIGVSTGGPSTLPRLLRRLPGDFPAPILIAQHMPAGWTETLAGQLDEECDLKVTEAKHGETVEGGGVYIAPGDCHLELTKNFQARVIKPTAPGGLRPSSNMLFKSVALAAGPKTMAIVLTGMGNDGTDGARAVREAGGTVIAQDEQSSVVYGMPKSVADAGLANQIVHIDKMAELLI